MVVIKLLQASNIQSQNFISLVSIANYSKVLLLEHRLNESNPRDVLNVIGSKVVCKISVYSIVFGYTHTYKKKTQGAHIGAFGGNDTLCIIARSKRPQWWGQFIVKKHRP